MPEEKIFYRRHLPHFQPPGAILFVTFRLYNSLPSDVIERLIQESEALERSFVSMEPSQHLPHILEAKKKMFAKWDAVLDQLRPGPRWLENDEIAQIVADALHYLDGKKYELIAYCIMPNHVHVVFKPLIKTQDEQGEYYYPVYEIMRSLKGFTAWKINRILNQKGAFWQEESYDHVVRDESELQRIVEYVLMNPVKAGLVESPEMWKWSYYKFTL
ncbi:MAG: transposase [Chloroflexi bacterium]|nr:transposase [Chloroflexota bacterium]